MPSKLQRPDKGESLDHEAACAVIEGLTIAINALVDIDRYSQDSYVRNVSQDALNRIVRLID